MKKICDYWKLFTGDLNAKYGPYCRYDGCYEFKEKSCRYKKLIKEKRMRKTIEERVEKLKSKVTKREFEPGNWFIRLGRHRAHLMKKAGFYELPNFLETECGESMPMDGDTLECDPTYPEWKKCPDCRALSETEPTFDGLMALLRKPVELGGTNANV